MREERKMERNDLIWEKIYERIKDSKKIKEYWIDRKKFLTKNEDLQINTTISRKLHYSRQKRVIIRI